MALNPYTLNHLYEKGILEYVPTDLGISIPLAPMQPMSNPYLDLAIQGNLYQNSVSGTDTFTSLNNNISTQSINNNYNGIGSMSNAGGINSFIGNGIGAQNNSSIPNNFGFNNTIGKNSNAGFYNSFMGNGVGEQHRGEGGIKVLGNFSDVENGLKGGINKGAAIINNTPKVLLGLLAGAIGTIGIMSAFKKGKKPPKTGNSFIAKCNPLNWFKKKK